jgi:hypothetical protein
VTTAGVTGEEGPKTGFSFRLTLKPLMVSDPKQPGSAFGVRQFIPSELELVSAASPVAPLERVIARTTPGLQSAAKAGAAWRDADAKATKIRGLITALNQEMAFLALNAGAMASLQAARSDAFAFFGKEI